MEHNLKEFFDKALKEVSLDCTVFGFHEGELKVLLLRWKGTDEWSLPGGHILLDESVDDAANRILTQRTGLSDIYLQQFHTFGNVDRYTYHSEKELVEKLEPTFGKGFFDDIIFRRVVSIGYYALVEFAQVQPTPDWFTDECRWWSLADVPRLLFDHNEMIDRALTALRQRARNQPIGYNLLPEKFTMPELQRLYETILARQFDRRNFQKLIMSYNILERLEEKRIGAANKSPFLYRFIKEKYDAASIAGVSMMQKFILLFLVTLFSLPVLAQSKWKLIADEEQIRIYSSAVPESKIKAIRVDCVVDASLAQMVALVLDVEAGTEWVYKTKSCTLVKRVSPTELYYHSEVSLPWPLDNRDFVAHLVARQEPATKAVTIDGPVVAGMVPVKKNVVRVRDSKGRWVLTPIGSKVRIEYMLYTDPGGYLPAWAVNAFAAEGPMETFKSMKQQLKLPKYRNASLTFIAN